MKMPIDKEWYGKKAAAEGDHEIGAGHRGPPPAYNGCTCSCHLGSGKMHIVACCSPPPQPRADVTYSGCKSDLHPEYVTDGGAE